MGQAGTETLGIKNKFQAWIESDCKIEYRCANNYMRVLKASLQDASIKEMGLTDAYLKLRLVTRKAKAAAEEEKTQSSDAIATQNGGKATAVATPLGDNSVEKTQGSESAPTAGTSTTIVQRRRLGALEVERRDEVYVLEIDTTTNWQNSLLDAFSDVKNFTAVLANGGLLLKLKE